MSDSYTMFVAGKKTTVDLTKDIVPTKLQRRLLAIPCGRLPSLRGSRYLGLWSQKPLRVWFLGPESLNTGYLDLLVPLWGKTLPLIVDEVRQAVLNLWSGPVSEPWSQEVLIDVAVQWMGNEVQVPKFEDPGPKTINGMVFDTRYLKSWVLRSFGHHTTPQGCKYHYHNSFYVGSHDYG